LFLELCDYFSKVFDLILLAQVLSKKIGQFIQWLSYLVGKAEDILTCKLGHGSF